MKKLYLSIIVALSIYYSYAQTAEEFTKTAVEMLNQKKYQVARNACRSAINVNPKYAPAYYNLALAVSPRTEEENTHPFALDALNNFEQAIKLDPNYTDAFFQRGLLYFNIKKWYWAIDDFNKVIKLSSKYNEIIYIKRGVSYMKMQKWDEAITDLNKAIELTPNSANAYLYRANLYDKLKQPENSIADYTKAIEIDPKMLIGFLSRGYIFFQQEQWEKSINDFTKVIEINPSIDTVFCLRGFAFKKMNIWDKACPDFKKAYLLGNAQAAEMIERFCK